MWALHLIILEEGWQKMKMSATTLILLHGYF